jgi:hypothetical protein
VNNLNKLILSAVAATAILAAGAANALNVRKPSHGRTHIGTVYQGGIFNDGGGTTITPTRNGGIIVKKIPPWGPKYGTVGNSYSR